MEGSRQKCLAKLSSLSLLTEPSAPSEIHGSFTEPQTLLLAKNVSRGKGKDLG